MVNSKKLPKNRHSRKLASSPEMAVSGHPLAIQLNSFLSKQLKPKTQLLLALSGGLDSCVLLHLLAQAKNTFPFELQAMHVHHGLSANADQWAEFCKKQCELLKVPLKVVHVDIDKNLGLGIEAVA